MPKFNIVCSVPVDFHIEVEADTWNEACRKVFELPTKELFAKSATVVESDGRIIAPPDHHTR